MRSTKFLALAALALPLVSATSQAAPASAAAGAPLAKMQQSQPIAPPNIGMGHAGSVQLARSRGHWHGGGGGHWHGGHHWHGHGGGPFWPRHRFYPGWYGYGAYYPDAYYYDDDVYERGRTVYAEDDAVERCAARYRSFDPRSGTFMTNRGQRKVCPYLR